jgi:peptidoglycan/xylan/chitin deacetylase (PgdA/CDA1 family)
VLKRILLALLFLGPLCFPGSGGSGPSDGPSLAARSGTDESPATPSDVDSIFDMETPRQPTRDKLVPSAFPRFLGALPGEPDERPVSKPSERQVLLTFDDGPDLQGTTAIMNELDRRGLKAVFFVMARHIVRNQPTDLARRELLRRLAQHGHHVGNHTMNHLNLCRSPKILADEIDSAAEIITYSTGTRPFLFRSPYGARCKLLDRALDERDVIQVGWNVDPQEWRGDDEDAIYKHVTRHLARAAGPVILLLHDRSLAAGRALVRILDWIDEEQARVAQQGGLPIRVVDYRVLLANPPVAPLAAAAR